MELPDGRPLIVDDGILAEPPAPDGRIVLWLPGDRDGPYLHWDRVGTVARAAVVDEGGIRSVIVTATPARQRIVGPLGRLIGGLGKSRAKRAWTLPGGGSAEQHGDRRSDLVLAWADDESPLDEARIRARWPRASDSRPVGPGLFLVSGIEPSPPPADQPSPEDDPLRLAERSLASARGSGDFRRVATSLADLGLARLLVGDAPLAAAALEESLYAARWLGDPSLEADAMAGLALAALKLGQPARSLELLAPALAHARSVGDPHAEKAALDRMAQAHSALGDQTLALAHLEQAIPIAAATGDRPYEANLRWAAAVAEAELGRRDRSVAHAVAAVDLLRRLGNPKADWYAHHLANFRDGDPAAALVSAGKAPAFLGGSIDTSVLPVPPDPGAGTSGPGLLRMALTATKAMFQFVGSGFRTASPADYRARLETCRPCEHHTGVRCRVCGCITAVKAHLEHERCPIGKWPT